MGGDIVTDAFGVVAMVAMPPLITIQVLGLVYRISSTYIEEAETGTADAAFVQSADDEIIEL